MFETISTGALPPSSNEYVRERLRSMSGAALRLSEHADEAEILRRKAAQRTLAGQDGVAVKKFDPEATAAVQSLSDAMTDDSLAQMRDGADAIRGAADAALAALAPWQQDEDLVKQTGVDPTTLDASTS